MFKNFKISLCLSLCTILTGCNNATEYSFVELQEMTAFITVSTNMNSKNCLTDIIFHNEKGQVLKTETIKTDGDISYQKFTGDHYYLFGPGGLIDIDHNEMTIERLSDGNINDIDIEEEEMYLYVNGGFNENGKYNSKIQSLSSKYELRLEYPVRDMEYHNGYMYTIRPKESIDGDIFINVFEADNMISSTKISEDGCFYILNDEVYLLTQSYLMNVNSNEKIAFVDEAGNPMRIHSTSNAIYKNSDGYVLEDKELSGNQYFDMEIVDNKIKLTKLDVKAAGNIINSIFVEGKGFFLVNKEDELYKLTIDQVDTNVQKIEVKEGGKLRLYMGYEII